MNVALMLPRPVVVYEQAGKTFITTMLPSTLVEFYPESGIDAIASAVEKAVLQIIDEAK